MFFLGVYSGESVTSHDVLSQFIMGSITLTTMPALLEQK